MAARTKIAVSLVAALAACQAVNRTVVTEAPSDAPFASGQEVAAERSFEEHPGANRRQFQAVWTKPAWDALWQSGTGPKIDFSRSMVLAAFSGRRPTAGHSVRIERIVRVADVLMVEVHEASPARECAFAEAETHPAHLVAVPRFEGTVRFVVRRSVRGSCLQPPSLRLSCRVDSPDEWRSLGPILYAKPGDTLQCEAGIDPGASLGWRLLATPEGSRAVIAAEQGRARLPIDLEGSYLLGAETRGVDGQVSLRQVRLETATPRYEVALVEEEPEGALGLAPVLTDSQVAGRRCSAAEVPGWCSARADGYETRLSVSADEPGPFELRVRIPPQTVPTARLVVRLGERTLADLAVPDLLRDWGSEGWFAGTLHPRSARFEPAAAVEKSASPR